MNDELYHHGIKGQRWGVRNGPPYPLNAQTHASVVKGSHKKTASNNRASSKIRGLKERWNNLTDEERKSIKKKILIGAGVAAGVAGGAVIGKRLYNARALRGEEMLNASRQKVLDAQTALAKQENAAIPKMEELARTRSGLVNEKLGYQNKLYNIAKDKDTISNRIRRKLADNRISSIDRKLTKNTAAQEAIKSRMEPYNEAIANRNNEYASMYDSIKRMKRRTAAGAVGLSAGLGAAGGYAVNKKYNEYQNATPQKRTKNGRIGGYHTVEYSDSGARKGSLADRFNQKMARRFGRSKIGSLDKLETRSNDSAVTRRVKSDYNRMSDSQFKAKYRVSKKVYGKRAEKYGDPYKNAPLAKLGRRLSRKRRRR